MVSMFFFCCWLLFSSITNIAPLTLLQVAISAGKCQSSSAWRMESTTQTHIDEFNSMMATGGVVMTSVQITGGSPYGECIPELVITYCRCAIASKRMASAV